MAENSIYDKTNGTRKLESPALGISINVYDAGSFVDEKTGEVKEYDAGIKIHSSGLKYPWKLNALQAKFLRIALNHPELMPEIDERAEIQKQEVFNL